MHDKKVWSIFAQGENFQPQGIFAWQLIIFCFIGNGSSLKERPQCQT